MPKDDNKKRSIYPPEIFSLKSFVFLGIPATASALFSLVVVVISDYDTAAAFSMIFLTGLLLLCLTWKTKHTRIKLVLSIGILVAVCVAGILFIKIGNYQKEVNRIVARHFLQSVGQALSRYTSDGHPLPECKWKCMTETIAAIGYWKEVSIPYEDSDQSATFLKIPPKDRWGCKYNYVFHEDGSFILKSSGEDRKFNNSNDISYFSNNRPPSSLPPLPVFP